MKHIKKTFLNQLTKDQIQKLKEDPKVKVYTKEIDKADFEKELKNIRVKRIFMETTKGTCFTGFPHKVKGQTYLYPEPDPTLIYFSTAQKFRRQIDTQKVKLHKNINPFSTVVEDDIAEDFYNYYETVCGTVLFLFLALESFLNDSVPKDFKYERVLKSKTEVFDHMQIQEQINFEEKLKKVLPAITGLNYCERHPLKSGILMQLKEFRDNIVHTKSQKEDINRDFLVTRSTTFKFDEAIDTIANFMNAYRPGYIIECDCGQDF